MSQANNLIVENAKAPPSSSSSDVFSVSISRNLHERIRKRLDKTEFTSVDSYVSYVLEQILLELENTDGGEGSSSSPQPTTTNSSPFSKEDQESVEQRLRDLGYL